MNEEEAEKLYSKVYWGRPGPVVTAAFIVRIPLDRVADLEAALAVMAEVKVVFRRTAVGHLFTDGSGLLYTDIEGETAIDFFGAIELCERLEAQMNRAIAETQNAVARAKQELLIMATELVPSPDRLRYLADSIDRAGSIKLESSEDAKIICLWLNSIFSLANLYDIRIVGEGAYVGWLKPDLHKLRVPDVRELPVEIRADLLSLFDELERETLPPLIEQLGLASGAKFEADLKLSHLLGLGYNDPKDLRTLYQVVARKFNLLDELQAEK